MRFSSNKDLNKLIANLIRTGWRIQRGGKHDKLWHPFRSGFVVVSRTPSDVRALRNVKAQVARIAESGYP